MNEKQIVKFAAGGVLLTIITALLIGWVMNIIEIVDTVDAELTGMFILRCIGVFFAPLGGILGWF